MKKALKIFIFLFIFLGIALYIFINTIFPVFIRMDDSIDLGSNYWYIQDYPQTIVIGDGKEVVFPVVLKYAYNENYIIAKTKDLETKDTLYWVVNKKTGKYEKCDSLNFEQLKKEYNVLDTLMLK